MSTMKKCVFSFICLILTTSTLATDFSIHSSHSNVTIGEPTTYWIWINCSDNHRLSGRSFDVKVGVEGETELKEWFVFVPGRSVEYSVDHVFTTENASTGVEVCFKEKGRPLWVCELKEDPIEIPSSDFFPEASSMLVGSVICFCILLPSIALIYKRKFFLGLIGVIITVIVGLIVLFSF